MSTGSNRTSRPTLTTGMRRSWTSRRTCRTLVLSLSATAAMSSSRRRSMTGADGVERELGSACRCHRWTYRWLLRPKRDQHVAESLRRTADAQLSSGDRVSAEAPEAARRVAVIGASR